MARSDPEDRDSHGVVASVAAVRDAASSSSLAHAFAARVSALRWEDLPDAAIHWAKVGILDTIAAELRALPNDVRVDGHTDSTPIDSPRYPTNWELSAARAITVTRYLSESAGIPAARFTAAGYGEYRPMVPNDTRVHRALNRRVEIHILSSSVGKQQS